MPELPEVETVKNGLKKKILNKKITNCKILYKNIIAYPDKDKFIELIKDETINDIKRRGKFLLFELDDYYLISHLRMEGKYFIKEPKEILNKHDHVIFTLDNTEELRYNDTRKFGKMYLVEKDRLEDSPLSKLGLEPWDNNLTESYLKAKLNKNKAIKECVMDVFSSMEFTYDQEIWDFFEENYAEEIMKTENTGFADPIIGLENENEGWSVVYCFLAEYCSIEIRPYKFY